MNDAPDRIWACMSGPMVGLFVSGGNNGGWPEYVRADAARAELEALDSDAIAKIRADALREAAEVGGQAAVDLLLRHEPNANVLKKRLAELAISKPFLALIQKENSYENL